MGKVSKKEPLISVIIPVYNVEKYLDRCINSVVKQTYNNLEIILVDDGSPDNCPKLCDEWAKKDSRIRVIHKKNAGVSAARNTGIDECKGDYISFVDSDDWMEETFCEEMLNVIKENKADYAACGYNRVYDDFVDHINCDGSVKVLDSKSFLKKLLSVQSGYGFVHMKLIKREVVDNIRFNTSLKVGEDALFNVELCDNLSKVVIYNKPLYNYYFNANSVVRKYDINYVDKYYESMKAMYEYISSKNYKKLKDLYNYIAYHVLLICVNYCYHPENKRDSKKCLKDVCNIPLFKEAIKKSNYSGMSMTRKISLFTIKHKMYYLTSKICEFRQNQFKKGGVNSPKRVLVGYVSDFTTSGIDKYILNYVDSVKDEDITFDFLTRYDEPNAKKVIKERGYRLYKVSRNRHFFKQMSEMKKLIKKNKYDVAYFNISESFNCVGIIAAKLFGVKKVVVHSHSSGIEKYNIIGKTFAKFVNSLFKPVISICSDLNLACSDKAAKWLYSRNVYDNDDYTIIYNAVDYKKFEYNEEVRNKIRKQFKIEDKFVLGHVGRFSYAKNHKFLIDIFVEYLKKNPESVLICVGEGPDFERIVEYSKKKNVYDKIIFTGPIDNVHEVVQAFDCFLLPSRFEGLAIVGVEAQFSQTKCLFSNRISKMTTISDDTIFLPINDPKVWAEKISSKKANLNKEAENYKLDKVEKQFLNITSNYTKRKNYASLLLKIVLAIHYVLNLTVFFNGFNYLMIISALLLPLIVIIDNFYYIKSKLSNYKLLLLYLLFLASYIISFLVMKKYDITGSIKVMIWTVLHLFFVFNCDYLSNKKSIKEEIYLLFKTLVLIISMFHIHNIYLLINRVHTTVTDFGGKLHPMGLTKWGRFYGNFYDANYTTIASVCAMFMAIYLIKVCKSKFEKVLFGITIFLQLVYLYFGQSRTGIITFAIAFLVYIFINYIFKNIKINKALVLLFALVIGVFVLPTKSLEAYNYLSNMNKTKEQKVIKKITKDEIEIEVEIEKKDEMDVGRTDYTEDYSNGRLNIWESGFKVFKANKIIGIGFANILKYAKENMPKLFIVRRNFEAFHNTYLDILVSQGIVGFAIAILIFLNYILLNIKRIRWIKNDKECNYLYTVLVSMIVGILVSSLFVSQIFYVNNLVTFIFWLLAGYLYMLLKKSKYE